MHVSLAYRIPLSVLRFYPFFFCDGPGRLVLRAVQLPFGMPVIHIGPGCICVEHDRTDARSENQARSFAEVEAGHRTMGHLYCRCPVHHELGLQAEPGAQVVVRKCDSSRL